MPGGVGAAGGAGGCCMDLEEKKTALELVLRTRGPALVARVDDGWHAEIGAGETLVAAELRSNLMPQPCAMLASFLGALYCNHRATEWH